jgi:hypothetical protein
MKMPNTGPQAGPMLGAGQKASLQLRALLETVRGIFTLFAVLLFVLIGAIGLLFILIGATEVRPAVTAWGSGGLNPAKLAIPSILEGIEFLLLAPVPFAVVVCVGNYLLTLRWNVSDHADSERSLHQVKGLVATLMVSVIAVELLRRFISEGHAEMADLYYGGGLIIVLLTYRIAVLGWPPKP